MDIRTGGTWLAFNTTGILCFILNQELNKEDISLETRSFVILEILKDATSIKQVLYNINNLDIHNIKPFNLIVMNKNNVYYISNRKKNKKIRIIKKLDDKLILLNRSFPNDMNQIRIKSNYEIFKKIKEPNLKYLYSWKKILLYKKYVNCQNEEISMSLNSKTWETLNSTILFLSTMDNHIYCRTIK